MNKGSVLLSKRLERKWDEKMQVEHRQRVHLAQKTINMDSPQQFLHLEQNLKRQQQDEGKTPLPSLVSMGILTSLPSNLKSRAMIVTVVIDSKQPTIRPKVIDFALLVNQRADQTRRYLQIHSFIFDFTYGNFCI